MSNSFDYFQKIYCCTIPTNTDRITFMSNQATKLDFTIQFITGKIDSGNPLAVTENHLKCYRDALEKGFERVLVLEDDCEFLPEIENLEAVLREWNFLREEDRRTDILYLGGWVMDVNTPVTAHLNHVSRITCLHSYMPTVDLMKKLSEEPFIKYCATKPLDLVISDEIVPLGGAYVARPLMTRQWPSWSTVRGKFDDKTNMQRWSREMLKNE